MFRTAFHLEFRVMTPLHVGAGHSRLVDKQRLKDGESIPFQSELALMCRDAEQNPWIPGSTLKGAFRNLSDASNSWVFGSAHGEAVAQKGSIVFLGSSVPEATAFEDAQTKIHAGTGASEANKLYFKECVAEGVSFIATLQLRPSAPDQQKVENALLALLGKFMAPEGIPIGAHKSDGQGAIKLISARRVVEELAEDGWKEESATDVELESAENASAHYEREMTCPGPYLTKRQPASGDQENEIRGQCDASGTRPRIRPSSIAGYLRARANWIVACSVDCKWGSKPRKTSSGSKDLDAVQRLFGDEGYRGSLNIRVCEVSASNIYKQTSVALDPISQGPFEGALFTYVGHAGVAFTLKLTAFRAISEPDEVELLELLKADLDANGMKLGMGTTKGFGWFNCEPSANLGEMKPPKAAALSKELEALLPDPRITVPYRMIEAELIGIGMPHPAVQAAAKAQTLLSEPLSDTGYSGHIDLGWCFETQLVIDVLETIEKRQSIKRDQEGKPIYTIPGTTLRGAIRTVLDTVTNARMRNVYNWQKNYEKHEGPFLIRSNLEELAKSKAHSPELDGTFIPDFVEAIFGYVKEGQGTDHQALHLKSRVSFGGATLVQGLESVSPPTQAVFGQPNPKAVMYDHLARKTYPSDKATPASVRQRLAAAAPGENDKVISTFQTLVPANDKSQPMVFESRICFHNLHETELGALLWAFTLGFNTQLRHKIGRAKAFGAGKCYVNGVSLNVCATDNRDLPILPSTAQTGKEYPFALAGHNPASFMKSFEAYLKSYVLDETHGFKEFMASCDPSAGHAMRCDQGLANDGFHAESGGKMKYQTTKSMENEFERLEPNRYIDVDDYVSTIRKANSGRIAGMLKKRK